MVGRGKEVCKTCFNFLNDKSSNLLVAKKKKKMGKKQTMNDNPYHIMRLTIDMVISAKIAKKSTITLALSPMELSKIPNAMQNAMIPATK